MEKYTLGSSDRPNWTAAVDDADLIELVSLDNESSKRVREGKAVCYLKRSIIKTTNEGNEDYSLSVFRLNNADTLQTSSMRDMPLRDNQRLEIYKIAVIRNNVIESKEKDTLVRVFDNEGQSAYGVINNEKKAHISISGLHVGDVLIFEYCIKTVFGEADILDKEYFRCSYSMPESYFFYGRREFKLLQNRREDMRVSKKYFKGEGTAGDAILRTGEVFSFDQTDYQNDIDAKSYIPFIDISTDSTWEDISTRISQLYRPLIESSDTNGAAIENMIYQETDPDELKLQKTIEYVQNSIVYLYDAEIMHSHLPQGPEKTLAAKAGDCKAKSLLLVKLLKSMGIDSEIILVNYAADYFIPTFLPSPFVFNHAIVRMRHGGKEYFIDPTTSQHYGSMDNRSEPFFKTYLPAREHSSLQNKELRKITPSFNVEDEIFIWLGKRDSHIKINSTFRLENADNLRNAFSSNDSKSLADNESNVVRRCMFDEKRENHSSFVSDATFEIVSDDKVKNEIKTSYRAKLNDCMVKHPNALVFKYHNILNYSYLLNFEHNEHLASSFVDYPTKTRIEVKSRNYVSFNQTLRNIFAIRNDVKNEYFELLTSTYLYPKTAISETSYVPKTYEYVRKDDLKNLKRDYRRVHDESKYGIGLIYQTPLNYCMRIFWLAIVIGWFVYARTL